jgi:hypothetical protein
MEANRIPQSVLFDELRRVIGSSVVRTAVFLTFQFDPEFFETEILPVLFDRTLSHAPPVRLVQLHDAILELQGLAVYYDARALTADAKPARLDYARIGLTRSTGYFHPKNVFLLVRDPETETDSLILVTLSANLTRAGWWENVEVAHIEEVAEGAVSTLRDDLMSLLNRIKGEDRMDSDHSALELVHEFVRYRTFPRENGFGAGAGSRTYIVGKIPYPNSCRDFNWRGTISKSFPHTLTIPTRRRPWRRW